MKIASLGLLAHEKKIIEDYLIQYNPSMVNDTVDWVPINSDNFKTVITRASFLGSTDIDKYLNKFDNINVLCICRNESDLDNTFQHNIPVLNISEKNPNKIGNWINSINSIGIEENIYQEINDEDLSNNDLLNKSSKINSAEGVSILFSLLRTSKDVVYLTTESGGSSWIDCSKSQVYSNIIDTTIPAIECYEYQVLPSDFNLALISERNDINSISLNEWLWEVMWRTDLELSSLISEDSSYKLIRWPHFCQHSKVGRTESLRLSSKINRQPISYGELLLDSDYSKNIVNKFVCSMLNINYIKEVSVIPKSEKEITTNQITNNIMKKSLLNKIRNIIGL